MLTMKMNILLLSYFNSIGRQLRHEMLSYILNHSVYTAMYYNDDHIAI